MGPQRKHGQILIGQKNSLELNRNTRAQYHKGGATWESDRYGPAIPLVGELHRRMEEAVEKAQT